MAIIVASPDWTRLVMDLNKRVFGFLKGFFHVACGSRGSFLAAVTFRIKMFRVPIGCH
jgi:hypothetical protein